MSGFAPFDILALSMLGFVFVSRVWMVYEAVAGNSINKWVAQIRIKHWLNSWWVIAIDCGLLAINLVYIFKETSIVNAAYVVGWCMVVWADWFVYSYHKNNPD